MAKKNKNEIDFEIPPENGWRRVVRGYMMDRSSSTQGELSIGVNNLAGIVEAARIAGIPEKYWNQIEPEKDYSGCFYEGDEPSVEWRFPLTVFKKD